MQRRTGIAIALVALTAAAAGIAWSQWPVGVETAQSIRGPAIEAVYATGIVEPTVMVPVAPRSGGRLAAINVEEGAQVRRGQVLARIESADLDQTVQEMLAREQLARTQFERTRDLVAQNFISSAELDRTRTEFQAAQAAVMRARAQRDYNQLVAPADGTVLRRDGELGQFIAAGQTVLTLSCCAPLRVSAEVDEEDIARVCRRPEGDHAHRRSARALVRRRGGRDHAQGRSGVAQLPRAHSLRRCAGQRRRAAAQPA